MKSKDNNLSPLYCRSCGRKLVLHNGTGFNPYTGTSSGSILQCPKYSKVFNFANHSRFEWTGIYWYEQMEI